MKEKLEEFLKAEGVYEKFVHALSTSGINTFDAFVKKWKNRSLSPKKKLIFQKGSNTIRQMPENYLISHFLDNSWRCEPDLAADKSICMKVFEELLNFESKYNPDGDEIINKIEL